MREGSLGFQNSLQNMGNSRKVTFRSETDIQRTSVDGHWGAYMTGRLIPSFACLTIILTLCLLPSSLLAGKPNIVLSQPLNFQGVDGNPISLSPGKYFIEQAGPTQLRITKADDNSEFLIQAQSLSHEQYELFSPMAFTRPQRNKEFLIELFLPGGRRLEARGSSEPLQERSEVAQVPGSPSQTEPLTPPTLPVESPSTEDTPPTPEPEPESIDRPQTVTPPAVPTTSETIESLEPKPTAEDIASLPPPTVPEPEPPSMPSFTPPTIPEPEPPSMPSFTPPTIPEPEPPLEPTLPENARTDTPPTVEEPEPSKEETPLIAYQAPSEVKPGLRIDAISRENTYPSIYVIAPDHVGLTSQEYPVLYWCLTGETQYPLDVMISEEENLNILLDVRLLPPMNEGIHELRLEDYGISLQPGVSYRWTVRLVASQSPVNLTASGVIQRKDSPNLNASTFASSLPYSPEGYAQKGLWYDAFSAVSQLLLDNPSNTDYTRQRDSLLSQVGLQNISVLLQQTTSR